MSKKQPFAYVTIFYDRSDPSNPGWAYNCIDSEGEHTSGALNARRINAKLPSLHRALKREFRYAGFSIPPAYDFHPSHEGLGWECGTFPTRGAK